MTYKISILAFIEDAVSIPLWIAGIRYVYALKYTMAYTNAYKYLNADLYIHTIHK